MKTPHALPSPVKSLALHLIAIAAFVAFRGGAHAQTSDLTITNSLTLQASSTSTKILQLGANGSLLAAAGTAGATAIGLDGISGSLLLWDPGICAFRAGFFGSSNLASSSVGSGSAAFGRYSFASGDVSTALGNYTRAESFGSFVIGQYNVGGYFAGSGSTTGRNTWFDEDPAFEIGNGHDGSLEVSGLPLYRNALTVYKNGNATFMGVVRVAPGGDIPMFGH